MNARPQGSDEEVNFKRFYAITKQIHHRIRLNRNIWLERVALLFSIFQAMSKKKSKKSKHERQTARTQS